MSELLQSNLVTPHSTEFHNNLILKEPRYNIDRPALILQRGTSTFKIYIAEKFLKDVKRSADFYKIITTDKGEKKGAINPSKEIEFQTALDCFFLFTWGTITSVSRELFYTFNLKIKLDKIYFYKVREALNNDSSNKEIASYFNDINDAEWFKYLNKARNRVEHDKVPMLEHRPDGSIVLADDQSVGIASVTTDRNYEVISWTARILAETIAFMESCASRMNKHLYG